MSNTHTLWDDVRIIDATLLHFGGHRFGDPLFRGIIWTGYIVLILTQKAAVAY